MKMEAIILDLGGVLIDWNPAYLFDKLIEDPDRKRHFFEHICTSDWNEQQDGGRPLQEAMDTLAVQHPEWREYIEAYYGRWEEMLGGPIQETVDILRELKESGRYRLYALTNWSGELFPIALQRYEFLHWFDGRVVSGDEKMRKPFPEFYHLILSRYHLQPERTLFIDDNVRNIKAAEALGINCIAFESPRQLRTRLTELGVL